MNFQFFKKRHQPSTTIPNSTKKNPTNFQEKKYLTDFVGKFANNLIEDMKVAIVLINSSGFILYANKEASNLTEYSNSEILGMNISKLIHPKALPQALKSIASEFIGNISPQMDVEIKTKNNQSKILRFPTWNTNLIDAPAGKCLLIWGFDVTKELETKKELQKNVNQLKKMNEYMIDRETKMTELKNQIEILKGRASS